MVKNILSKFLSDTFGKYNNDDDDNDIHNRNSNNEFIICVLEQVLNKLTKKAQIGSLTSTDLTSTDLTSTEIETII